MRTVDRLVIFAAVVGVATAALATALSTWTTGVLVGAAGFVSAYGGGLWLLQPMARYVSFIQRLAEGDFDEEAPATKERRFAPVAKALEAMRLHLRTWMGQIARSAIEFEGSLQVLDLIHVMHFLRAGRRSGTLVLQRGGEMALQFWKGGEVVGALCGGEGGLEALKAPFGWERGSFKFSPRLDPTVNLNARWEVLLLTAVRGVDNPKMWGRLVPKPSTIVRRSARADHMPVRQLLTADEWTIWSAVGGEVSAQEVAARLGETTYKAWHALYCFCALGLVEPADGSALAGFASSGVNRAEPIQMPVRGPWPAATAGAELAPTLRSCDAPPDQAAARRDTASEHAAARRDASSEQAAARRDAGSEQAAARRDAASEQATARRDAASEQAVARRNTPSWQRANSGLQTAKQGPNPGVQTPEHGLRPAAGGNVISLEEVRRRGR